MTQFDAQYAEAFAGQYLDALGAADWSYQPAGGGAAVTGLTVALRRGPGALAEAADGHLSLNELTGTLDVSPDLVTPTREGTFTDGSESWTVIEPPYLEGGAWHCIVRRRTRHSAAERRTKV